MMENLTFLIFSFVAKMSRAKQPNQTLHQDQFTVASGCRLIDGIINAVDNIISKIVGDSEETSKRHLPRLG